MKPKRKRFAAAVTFVTYSAVLIALVVFKAIPTIRIGHMRYRFSGTRTGPSNLVPFKTIGPMLRGGNRLIAKVNLLGNVLLFMPVGFLAPLLFRRMTWRGALLLAVATGLTMETLELIFQVGIFDVDDIMLNALGVMLGYWMYALSHRKRQQA